MKILCTICMRSGSKELKNKNLKLINNKPLMYYTINNAINSKYVNEVFVMTDSLEMKKIAKKNGVHYKTIYRWKKDDAITERV